MPEPSWPPTIVPNAVDVFIDLSASTAPSSLVQSLIDDWTRPESLGAVAHRIVGVLPTGTQHGSLRAPANWHFTESISPIAQLGAAAGAAGRDRIPLLLLAGPVDISNEALGVLRSCLSRDPMFGFAVPRIGCTDRCCFRRLSRHGIGPAEWLPRTILADLEDTNLLAEITGPCVLFAPQIVANFAHFERRFEGIAAALLHYMAAARRCGFRTVLSNRAMVGIAGGTCRTTPAQQLVEVSKRDQRLVRELVPELDRSWDEFRGASWERFERLCTAVVDVPRRAQKASLLLDIRNVRSIYNGTAQAVLGTVQGFRELRPSWDVALLAHPEGAAFHDLERAYDGWPVYTTVPDRSFTAAVRLSQPWHIQEMADLHRVSLFNAYLVLDTINWDIVYSAPRHLEGTWQFLADRADGLLFDSQFTADRFFERFPAASAVPSLVTHFSFEPSEYTHLDAAAARSKDDFILVVGNDLDHKDVRQTVETLASAFPFRRIKALGPIRAFDSPFITGQRSGAVPEPELHRLYASASYVVFPSFYEGFGFPILTALAYGRTVLARRSTLLDEVAARCARRGRLVVFDRREELVDLIGRLAHGEAVDEHPLGLGLNGGQPRRWRDVADDIVSFLEPLVHKPPRSRWIARESAVRQLESYRT